MEFDIEYYKGKYGDELHVLILQDGHVQIYEGDCTQDLVSIVANKYKLDPIAILESCPYSNLFSIFSWLCTMAEAAIVNSSGVFYSNGLTQSQISTLQLLKDDGLYNSDIPYSTCN